MSAPILCNICGYKQAIPGYEVCESCLPTFLEKGTALAEKALKELEEHAAHMREMLAEPEKYGMDEALKEQTRKALRYMEDENRNSRGRIDKAKEMQRKTRELG